MPICFFSDTRVNRVDPFEADTTHLLRGGRQGLMVVGDLMNLDDCERALEETVAASGGLDLFINSGG